MATRRQAGRPARSRAALACAAVLIAGSAAAGCDALTGAHERSLETDAGSKPSDDGGGVLDAPADAPASDVVDAGYVEVPVSKTFTSPNGASWKVTDGGVVITSVDAGASGVHGIIVPSPQPQPPLEDFTVWATVRAPASASTEFGILTRMQPGGHAVIFGSSLSDGQVAKRPFLTTFAPPAWEPVDPANQPRGPAYTYVPNALYRFKVQAVANRTTAKMWDATTPEPPDSTAPLLLDTFSTGHGIGFYTFGANGAVLEELRMTVP